MSKKDFNRLKNVFLEAAGSAYIDDDWPDGSTLIDGRVDLTKAIKAVILELQEPSNEMIYAAFPAGVSDPSWYSGFKNSFKLAIEKLLEE